jgi:hypothetical protein
VYAHSVLSLSCALQGDHHTIRRRVRWDVQVVPGSEVVKKWLLALQAVQAKKAAAVPQALVDPLTGDRIAEYTHRRYLCVFDPC